MPPDESAVPEELVPGAPRLVPAAPPVEVEWCIPIPPPPRLKAAVGTAMEARTHTVISIFMTQSSVCIPFNGAAGTRFLARPTPKAQDFVIGPLL
jgi:hypothetical protein